MLDMLLLLGLLTVPFAFIASCVAIVVIAIDLRQIREVVDREAIMYHYDRAERLAKQRGGTFVAPPGQDG